MPDWSKSMTRTFEYYIVNPRTWKDDRQLKSVKSCSISRDSEVDTLGSATIDTTEQMDECYIRVYLITSQDGVDEKFPLGTFLAQTPSVSFDGKVQTISMDAYTPLIELKENPPPLGYSILEGDNIMDIAYRSVREHARAPVVKTTDESKLYFDFVADPNDTWITFLRDLISNAKYIFDLDEMGRILFAPKQELASLQPIWTYNDDNSSILTPDFTLSRDLYGIPNVVEVSYSSGKNYYYARVVNDDPNSPISTVRRGREIIHRVTNPDMVGEPSNEQIEKYADDLLKALSTIEYTITYTHGYCPVRLNDCVRLNYTRAGLVDTKAKVISQDIKCTPECLVTEKAIFTTRLWR